MVKRLGGRARSRGRWYAAAGFVAVALALLSPMRPTFGVGNDTDLQDAREQLETQLTGLFDRLDDASQLADALPLSSLNPADALNLDNLFDDGAAAAQSLRDKLASAGDIGSEDELETFLDGLDLTYDDADHEAISLTVGGPTSDGDDGVPVVTKSGTGDTAVVDIELTLGASATVPIPIDFATGIIDLIAAGSDGTFPVTVALETNTLHLRFEKGLVANPATAGQALYLVTTPATPTVTLSATSAGADLSQIDTTFGFSAVSVIGDVSFDIDYVLSVFDPDDTDQAGGASSGDGKITADEWTSIDLADLVFGGLTDDETGNDVDAQIHLDSTLISGSPDLTIGYTDADVSQAPAGEIDLDESAPLNDLRNFSAEEALGALQRLVMMLDGLQNTGALDLKLPFMNGFDDLTDPDDSPHGTFSDAIRVAKTIEDAISDPDTDGDGLPNSDGAANPDLTFVTDDPSTDINEIGKPAFSSAQALELLLEDTDILGVDTTVAFNDDDPEHRRLEFSFQLSDEAFKNISLGLGDIDVLSAVNLTDSSTLTLFGGYTLNLGFALDLTEQPTEDRAGIGSCTDGIDNGAPDADIDPTTVELDPAPTGGDAADPECAGAQTLEQRVQIQVENDADVDELIGSFGVVARDFDASARIGLLEAAIDDAFLLVGSGTGEDGGSDMSTCADGADDDGASGADADDPDCRAKIGVDIADPAGAAGDGWLTIEELFNALGTHMSTKVTAGVLGSLPVSADLLPDDEGDPDPGHLGSGTIQITSDPLVDAPVSDALELLESVNVTTDTDFENADFLSFSPCDNNEDDDGDGTINDGCGTIAANDESEASSAALLAHIFDTIRQVAGALEDSDVIPAGTLDAPIPLVGASFNDIVSFADAITALADGAEQAGESALIALGMADACTNAVDDDFDGAINDGCPTAPGADNLPEAGADCFDDQSNDSTATQGSDTVVNDGCPGVAPSLQRLVVGTATERGVLEQYLERLLASAGTPNVDATLDYDDATEDLELVLDVGFERVLPTSLSLDLPGTLGSLVSLDALDSAELTLGADLDLGLGLNLDTFTPYIRGDSALDLNVEATVEDVFFTVGVGSLQVQVGQEIPTPETGDAQCGTEGSPNTVDDDGDGYVNDGCPAQADAEDEDDCGNEVSDDDDAVIDDGCGDTDPATAGSRAEAGAECSDANGDEDNDDLVSDGGDPPSDVPDDAVGDDGCPPDPPSAMGSDGDGEAAPGDMDDPDCAIDDVDSDDNDDFVNDGCPARADRARFFLGAGLSLDMPGDDTTKNPLGTAPTFAFHGADPAAIPQWCTDLDLDGGPNAGDEKDVCAVLPLFADIGGTETAIRPDGGDPDDHHVKVAIENLTDFDASSFSIDYDTSKLLEFIQGQLIDLFLMNSGLDALLNALEDLLETDLFSFAVPLIGGQTASAADIVGRLRTSVADAVADFAGSGEPGSNPLAGATSAGAVAGLIETLKNNILGELADPDGNPATTDGFDVPGDFTVQLLCGDPAAACDYGAEDDAANPAVQEHDLDSDASNNCAEPAVDDDGDGVANDGCDGADPAVSDPGADVSDIRMRFTLTDSIAIGGADGVPLDFDVAIPGLGLSATNATLNGGIDLSFAFGFGISKNDGFYFLTDDLDGDTANDAPEIDLSTEVRISDPTAALADRAQFDATLGFLEVVAVDGDAPACDAPGLGADDPCTTDGEAPEDISSLGARFVVNVVDPSGDGRLTFDELSLGPDFGDLIEFGFRANADVHLHVETGFPGGAGLPKLIFDLGVEWAWNIGELPEDPEAAVAIGDLDDNAGPGDLEPGGSGSNLNIYLDNVSVDAGTFISKFLAPVFEDVTRFTKPLQPIIDTVTACIPVLTDLSGECVNLLTLSQTLGLVENVELIEVIAAMITFANDLGDFSTSSHLRIPIGDGEFALVGDTLRQGAVQPTEASSVFDPAENIATIGPIVDDLSNAVSGAGGGDLGSSFGDNASIGDDCGGKTGISATLCGVGVRLPFLESPGKTLGILFGQDVDLIVWEPPQAKFGFSYSQKLGPIWATPPVFLEVGGSVDFTINFGIGYSSKGFRLWALNDAGPSALLQGLFLVDKHPLEGGSDLNELELRGELFANAQVSVLIFSAGAGGSIFLTIGVDLEDPNGDGRLEFQEAADIINSTGNVLCIFNLNGNFGVRMFVFAEVDLFFWSQRWEKTLAEIILYEFKVKCEPLPDPVLAHAEGTVLFLHVGDARKLRDPEEWASPLPYDGNPVQTEQAGDNTPDNSVGFDKTEETFKVVRTADGVEITAFGITQTYDGAWTEIRGNAGDGDDVIALVDGKVEGQSEPLEFNISANLDGGGDDDELTGSTVADTLSGGPGADTINGRDGVNHIYGDARTSPFNNAGDGKDVIESGTGDDFLYGGGGDDRISAGPGVDRVEGNDGNDQIDGGRSQQGAVDGGDRIFGDNSDGGTPGEPADDSDGAEDSDTIDGGDGDDVIFPSGGADLVNGGPGDDEIYDSGDDIACNQPHLKEDDVLTGGPGADIIDAGHGDDIVIGGSLAGGQPDEGDTRLNGGDECDTIWGDNVSRTDGGTIYGVDPAVGGDDNIQGGDGADELHGQRGDDVLDGDADDDDTGEPSSNRDGNDLIYGDEPDSSPQGNDDAFGDGGADTIYGRGGEDDLVGGDGGDHIFGEAGWDCLIGDVGSVANTATRDDDVVTLTSGSGRDDLHGGPGRDRLFGQGGRDDLFGDGGDDDAYGDGHGAPNGADGNDLVKGGVGGDYLFGNDGADDLYGEQGDDRIVGGSPTAGNADSGLGGVVGTAGIAEDPVGATFQDEILGGSGHDDIAGDNATINSPATLLDEASIGQQDLIYGEAGDDTMYGENGEDHIFGGLGDDHAEGGDDSDLIRGQDGQDDLIGGTTEAADGFATGHQPDTGDDIRGGDGHDVIAGDNARIERLDVFDDLDPARGINGVERRVITLFDIATTLNTTADVGFSGGEIIHGDDGYDIIYGQGGVDELHGGLVDDYLEGNNGADKLYGGEGQDDLIGGTGRTKSDAPHTASDDRLDDADELYGGDGAGGVVAGDDYDVEMGDNATVLRPDDGLTAGVQWDVNTFNDSIKRNVFLYDVATTTNPVDAATHGADLMRGENDADLMYGQGDGDDMEGAHGDDYMEGNDGADTIKGQGGNDDVAGGTGRINFDPPEGVDGRLDEGEVLIQGGVGFDTITGDNGIIRRVLVGGEWVHNTYNAGFQHEIVRLRDVATIDNPNADVNTSGGDTIEGNEQDDVLYGQGNDGSLLVNDVMYGNTGQDYMEGNAGRDIMEGNEGEDDMIGGTGRIAGDPEGGTPGRLDDDDKMVGNGDHDAMTGDNAVVTRPLFPEDHPQAGEWMDQTYRHFVHDATSAEQYAKVVRDVKMVDVTAGLTSGSDLMRGADGDDEMYGQLDDTETDGGYPAADAVAWCELPVPAAGPKVHPDFSLANVDAEGKAKGDVMCGDSGEDAMLGDNGEVNDIAEDGSRQDDNVRPNEPFIEDRIFVAETLTREATLQQLQLGGDDVVIAGPDSDSVHGGAGNDMLNGSLGDDRVFGDEGVDALWGGRDHDHLYGGYGDDFHDVRPRVPEAAAKKGLAFAGDPIAWFLFAPDDPATTQVKDGVLYEEYDGYQGVDYTYGGYDQDAHQANVGDAGPVVGDRLMDWAGSYNAYYLCPAVFGERVITRDMSPSMVAFWETLAKGDGVQEATVGEGKDRTIDSGFNELAMVYKPDVKANQRPVHPDTPGHFTCDEPLLAP